MQAHRKEGKKSQLEDEEVPTSVSVEDTDLLTLTVLIFFFFAFLMSKSDTLNDKNVIKPPHVPSVLFIGLC